MTADVRAPESCQPPAVPTVVRYNVPLRLLMVTIGVGGVAALAISIRTLIRQPIASDWFVLTVATVITGWSTLRVRNAGVSFSISDAFTMAAALLFGPAAGTVTVMLDALVMSLRVQSTNKAGMGRRILFNATAPALAMWLAAHMFFAITGSGWLSWPSVGIAPFVGLLAIFAAAYFVLNTGFVAVAVAYERCGRVWGVWRDHFAKLWLTYAGGAAVGGVIVLMIRGGIVDVKSTILLVLPLQLILHATYRGALDRAREQVDHLTNIAEYAAALYATADGVIVTDVRGLIRRMNPAAERLTGWTERDAMGRPAPDVMCLADPVTHRRVEEEQSLIDDGVREYRLIPRAGPERSIEELRSRVRNVEGATIGTVRTFRDVSDRKAIDAQREALLEREQRARAAADDANRMKDEFLATVSHALHTPANGIRRWIQLLKSGQLDTTQRVHALSALDRSAEAQAILLDDLLDVSVIAHGTVPLDLAPLDVRVPLKDACDAFEMAIRAKELRLEVETADVVPTINGDVRRLRQVFSNLLSNAIAFTDAGGWIRVSALSDAAHVSIVIRDNGLGIDPALLPVIFERFRQGGDSRKQRHRGLGLGLTIVRYLVEAHGGHVTAESSGRGCGAQFTVRLPALADALDEL